MEAHGAVRLRESRRHEIDSGVHLPRPAGHADPRLDPRSELPALAPGEPAYVPGVRIAARYGSFRQAGQRHRLPYWTAFIAEAEDAVVLNAFKRGDSA